jgi:hypothetical protein
MADPYFDPEYDPRKDPRYKDLFGADANSSPMVDAFLKSYGGMQKLQSASLQNEANEYELGERRRKRETESLLTQALKEKGLGSDFYQTAMEAAVNTGDFNQALSIQNSMQQDEYRDSLTKNRLVGEVERIGKHNPKLGVQIWNNHPELRKLGMIDETYFQQEKEKPSFHGDAWWDTSGDVPRIVAHAPEKPDKGEKPKVKRYINMSTREVRKLDENAPELNTADWIEYNPGSAKLIADQDFFNKSSGAQPSPGPAPSPGKVQKLVRRGPR